MCHVNEVLYFFLDLIYKIVESFNELDAGIFVFFFQAEDGIRDAQESRGLGDVYKRQHVRSAVVYSNGSHA